MMFSMMRQHGVGTVDSAARVSRFALMMRCLLVLAGAAVAWHGGAASAGVIIQSSGDGFLAFEAEDFDSLVSHDGKGFVVVDTTPTFTSDFGTDVLPAGTNASGGAAIIDDIRVENSGQSSTVTYRVIFQTPGTYRLYARHSAFEDNDNPAHHNNEDSFFRPASFNAAATERQDVSSGYTEGTYGWRNLSGADYTVTAADVGQPLAFNIDDRESGFSLDRMVFSTNTGLNSGALDALANSASVQGATHLTGTGNWSTGANWDNGEPDAAKTAYVGGGLTATIDQAGETAGLLVVGHNETVSPGDGTVSQTGGDLTITHDLILGQTGRSGTYRMTGGAATVGGAVLDAGASTLQLDEGTMTVAGGLSVDNLRVGLADADGAQATLTVNGGAVQIGSAGAGTLDVGLRTDGFPANAPTSAGVLDLGAASGVTIDVADIRMGVIVGGPSNEGQVRGDLILSQTGDNSITADSILAGDSPSRGNQVTSTLQLGAAANTISTDKLTLGGQKSSGTLTVAAGGTLALGGKSGAAADLDLGFNVTGNTGTHSSGTLDMSGGTLNATLGQVRLGQHNQGGGSGSGTLIFDAGVVNAASVAMGLGNGDSSGTITMNGGTMNVAGNVTDGPGTSAINLANNAVFEAAGNMVVDTLQVGVNSSVDGSDATLRLTGTTAAIGSASNKTNLYVGRRTAETAAVYQGTLDATAVTDLTMHLGTFGLGIGPSGASAQGKPGGTVLLAANSTIEADSITLAYSTSVGLGGRTSRLALGSGTTTILADSITVGGSKGTGVLDFQAPGGTLSLGTDADRVDVYIGNQSRWTGGGSTGTVDLSGGNANAFLGELVVGSKAGNATGTTRGTFTMTDGVVDASTVILARREDTGGVGAIHSTVNLQGGWLKAASIGGSPVNPNTAGDQLNFNWTGGRLSADAVGFDLLQTSTAAPSVLAPGRSIGTTSIDGNYTMDTGTLEIEIAGMGTGGIDYDFVMVEGDATLAGDLDAVLLGGFLPKMGNYFDVLHSTTGLLDIDDLTPPATQPRPGFGWWEIATVPGPAGDGLTLRLSAVPEPGTWLLLLAAGVCGLLVRRRR